MRIRWPWFIAGGILALLITIFLAALEPALGKRGLPPLPTAPPTATQRPTATLHPTSTPRPTATLQPTPTPWPWSQPRVVYDLDVTLDYFVQQAQVMQRVRFTNTGEETLDHLVFVLEPARYPGVLYLQNVQTGPPGGLRVALYELEQHRLTVHLREPLAPGQMAEVLLTYVLYLPRLERYPAPDTSHIFGYTSRQTNLVDWYALLAPHHPEQGWLVHAPWFYGEHLVYPVADYTLRFTVRNVPPGLQVVSNGDQIPCPEAPPEEVLVRCYRLENARQLVLSLSPYYRRVEAQNPTGPLVEGYFFMAEEAYGRDMVAASLEALETYTALFGPYHRKRLTLVQGDFPDGMEYDGLFFVSSRFFDFYNGDRASMLITITVHETAHQWWFAQVGNDQALHPWMDEALCTYAEALYYEHQYPQGLNWWWTYRVDYYKPRGPVDGDIYQYMGWRPYRDAVYLNGAHFLQDLRESIGDAAFFTFLQTYRKRWQGRIAYPQDFFQALEEAAPREKWLPVVTRYFQNAP